MKLLDFTTPEYDEYWKGIETGIYVENENMNFDCPDKYWEEIGQAYWFGMENGCICYG